MRPPDQFRGVARRNGHTAKLHGRRGYAEDQRLALATAPAQPGGPEATAAPLQLVHQMQGDAGPGRPDRVAERDRAAVDVDNVQADAEVAHLLDSHCGESLIYLDQIQIVNG